MDKRFAMEFYFCIKVYKKDMPLPSLSSHELWLYDYSFAMECKQKSVTKDTLLPFLVSSFILYLKQPLLSLSSMRI